MNRVAQRIAAAKMQGWKEINDRRWSGHRETFHHGAQRTVKVAGDIPDYANDLNAVHELEEVLTKKQIVEYVRALHWAVPDCDLSSSTSIDEDAKYIFPAIHATAPQRLEAILRACGKWDDSL